MTIERRGLSECGKYFLINLRVRKLLNISPFADKARIVGVPRVRSSCILAPEMGEFYFTTPMCLNITFSHICEPLKYRYALEHTKPFNITLPLPI